MDHHVYVDPILNEVTFTFQVTVQTLAYIFNFTLLYIIWQSSNKDIGTYRILISLFAIADIYYNTIHTIVYPIPEHYGNVFMMRGHGFYTNRIGIGLMMGAYGNNFPILAFHFLYRLFAVNYPQFLSNFPLFIAALVMSTLTMNFLWFSIFYWLFEPDEETLRHLEPVFNGSYPLPIYHTMDSAEKHVQALYWTESTFNGPRWKNLSGIGLLILAMTSTYTIMIICSFLINKYIKVISKSAQSGRLHKQLFRSLIYQSFVPLFTAFYPASAAVMLPAVGLSFEYASIFLPQSCVSHPLVDALVLIFTIADFRRAFLRMTGISKVMRAANIHTTILSAPSDVTQVTTVIPIRNGN